MTSIDHIVLGTYFAITVALGSFAFTRQKGLRDYFIGNRSTHWLAAMSSLVVTTISAVTFIGIPALSFKKDLTDLQIYFGFPLAALVAAWLIVPFYYRQDVLTAYEYLERRFDLKTRLLGSILFQSKEVFVLGIVIAAPSKILAELSGFSFEFSAVIVVLSTAIYTIIGGIRAVIWTDVMQLVVLLGGPILAMVILVQRMDGGLSQVIEIAQAHHKFNLIDTSLSLETEVTLWCAFTGLMLYWFAEWVISQSSVQRYLTGRSIAESRRALIYTGFCATLIWMMFFLIGIALFSFHQAFPNRLPAGDDPDRVFVRFILGEMPSGARGLAVSGVFAAAMSTLSSRVNSLASLTVVDIVQRLRPRANLERELPLARWMTFIWSVVGILVATVLVRWGGVIKVGLRLGNLFVGPLVGVFLLGMLSRRATGLGAFGGGLASVAVVGAIAALTSVSWGWYTLIGASVSLILGLGLSLFSPPRPAVGAAAETRVLTVE
jgi:SSS family solute:Na+ symporter